MTAPCCRYCDAPLELTLIDLGATPLANAYLPQDNPEALRREPVYPLKVMVCQSCWLAQTTETIDAKTIFAHDYAYLSSYTASWVAHASRYAEQMRARLGLGPESRVVEIASNDGYLLQHFVARKIPVIGVEPAGHAAEIAINRGVPTRQVFFGAEAAQAMLDEGLAADLMTANNVLAHVPDIRDFVAGFRILLKPGGMATFEFPHLANLIDEVQFDTIFHEHYSYLSLTFVERLMQEAGLEVFDVEELPTHGGSLRVFVGHPGVHPPQRGRRVIREREAAMGLDTEAAYAGFTEKVDDLIERLRYFLTVARETGKSVAAYGAAAKGNTLLNVAGITADQVPFVVDRNPEKQGTLLPGTHIPVRPLDAIAEAQPDYLLVLPWNLAADIRRNQSGIRAWGGQFVTAVPELTLS